MRAFIPALVLLPSLAVPQASLPIPQEDVRSHRFRDESMIALIANPKAWHGKKVRTVGYVHLAFESNAIYVHRDDETYGISANGLWLDLPKDVAQKYRRTGKTVDAYVQVQGTFNASMHGHFGRYSGTIEDIERFEVRTPRERSASPRNQKDDRSKPVQ